MFEEWNRVDELWGSRKRGEGLCSHEGIHCITLLQLGVEP